MTSQTNTASYWLDVANFCQQAEETAKAIFDSEPDGSAHKHAAMMVETYARDCRIAAMKLRAMVAVREMEAANASN